MTAVIIKRSLGVGIHTRTTSCEEKGRVEGDATESKEHHRFAANYQTLQERRGTDSLSQSWKEPSLLTA